MALALRTLRARRVILALLFISIALAWRVAIISGGSGINQRNNGENGGIAIEYGISVAGGNEKASKSMASKWRAGPGVSSRSSAPRWRGAMRRHLAAATAGQQRMKT